MPRPSPVQKVMGKVRPAGKVLNGTLAYIYVQSVYL